MPKKSTPKTSKKKTAKKKTASKKKVTRKKAAKKKAASKKAVSPEERYLMITEAAYYIAEKHNFSGDNVQFWLMAEAQIDSALKK